MTQREIHIIDGADLGGQPYRDQDLVEQITKEYEGPLLEVAGHTIRPIEIRVFELYCEAPVFKEVADKVGLSPNTIYKMTKTDWWDELRRAFIQQRSQDLYHRLAARYEETEQAFFRIINGEDKSDKTANAVIQAFRAFCEMGDKPLINRRPNVNITHNTQNNVLNANWGNFKDMSKAELFEFARTGKRPMAVE